MLEVIFHRPISAITPGQSVVLYDEETVLGGGTIRLSERTRPLASCDASSPE
jgi:tRNA-specific 2-thiouridylase